MSQHFPFLRFPFSNTTWLVKRVGDVASLISGVHLSPEEYDHVGSIPYFTGPSDITDSIDLVSKFTEKNSKLCKQGEVLITVKGSGVGKTAICKLPEAFMGRQLMSLRATPSLNVILKAIVDKNNKHLEALSMGNMIPGLSRDDILSLKISVPEHKDEQQKIADFLTAVDSKICQLTEKHRLLNEYKKGVMQQLFSQRLRFKDKEGNSFPEWEEKSIGDIMSESRVKGSGGDIAKKLTVKIWGKGVIPKKDDGRGSENTQYYKRKAGQFIYGKLDFLNCAFAIIPDELDGYESTLDLPSFDVSSSVNRYFILELVKQKKFYKRFGEIADGSRKAKRINVNVFQAMSIIIPSKEEQDKIMAFLGALDQKIAAVAEQIEQTKLFKKGLLQQMFV